MQGSVALVPGVSSDGENDCVVLSFGGWAGVSFICHVVKGRTARSFASWLAEYFTARRLTRTEIGADRGSLSVSGVAARSRCSFGDRAASPMRRCTASDLEARQGYRGIAFLNWRSNLEVLFIENKIPAYPRSDSKVLILFRSVLLGLPQSESTAKYRDIASCSEGIHCVLR